MSDVVAFDAADTLFHNRALAQLYADWARSADPRLQPEQLDRAIGVVGGRGLWPEDSATTDERLDRWFEFYRLVLAEAGFGPAEGRVRARACAATVVDPAGYALFDDVPPVLDALDARGMPMAVVSNFDALLGPILDAVGLRDRFRVVVSSYDVGCYKPDPLIFHTAAQRLGVPPAAVLFVGDSPYSDIGGATAAGMAAVLVDRSAAHPDFPGPRITRLTELPPWLDAAG
jgi:putative hydrolase of the HAD superfamily